jgi:hypothetical protein
MSGLNLYSFFKGVDDSNDEYRKQQDEERKKLEEFRAQEKLAREQQNQAQLEIERRQRNSEYADAEPTRKLTTQKAIAALAKYDSPEEIERRTLEEKANTDESVNASKLKIGANTSITNRLPENIKLQDQTIGVLQDKKKSDIQEAALAVEISNALTEAKKTAPAYGDSKLRDMDASEFARLPTLKERQDFLTKKGYGITANEDGSYKLGNSSLSFTEADVNLLITKPATAVKDILTSRLAAARDAGNFEIRQQTVDNATKIAGATVIDKRAGATKKIAEADATIKANSPPAATAKAAAPPSPPALQPSRPPLTGTVQPGGGTPPQSFSPTATATPAVTTQNVRTPNDVGDDGVSNEINRMSLSELDVFKKALESAVLPSQPDENRIIFDKIREINRVYGEKKGAENKASRDSESKSKEELAAKALADKKSSEKLTQDAAKIRAEDLIAKALAKAKNK